MKTTVFCPPGLERGAFALGALDTLSEASFFISRFSGASAGSMAAIFGAVGKIKDGIEELSNFDFKSLTRPLETGKEGVGIDYHSPSRYTSDGWREFFGGIEKRHDLLSRIKDSPAQVELLACDPVLGARVVLKPKEASGREEFVEMLSASSALHPLWPPVRGLVDGVFSPDYFLNEVKQNAEEKFIICRGDPSSLELETGRQLKNFISLSMRLMDLVCASKLNGEVSHLENLGIIGKQVFVLSHHNPLRRVNIFRKSRGCLLESVQCGRKAAQKLLESRF